MWRSDAWVLISKVGTHHTKICKEVAELIDDFTPVSVWRNFVLKMAHNLNRGCDFIDYKQIRDGEFLGRPTFIVHLISAEYQYVRTRARTQLRNYSPAYPILQLYQDEIEP